MRKLSWQFIAHFKTAVLVMNIFFKPNYKCKLAIVLATVPLLGS